MKYTISRTACVFSNIWLGIRAPVDGALRGGAFGYKIAPRFGAFIDMLTGWTIPLLCAGAFGGIGLCLGCVACIGCCAEGLRQFVAPMPYDKPISRILIDWIPSAE